MALLEVDSRMRSSAMSEPHQILHFPGMIWGTDLASLQAHLIGVHSEVPFMRQEQLDLYRELRQDVRNPDSDQVVYVEVLEKTGGPAEQFKALYPHIFNRT